MMPLKKSGFIRTKTQIILAIFLCGPVLAGSTAGRILTVDLRSRVAIPDTPGQFRVAYEKQQWDPCETAIIVCDMWDKHWCKGATDRVAELAPAMNRVVSAARDKGVLIVHAPSGTIERYKGHPARRTAMQAHDATNLPAGIRSWRQWKDEVEKAAGYPIDHSDGGCDCQPPCKGGEPWTGQVGVIEIKNEDAISDSGTEVWNLFEARGIKNVILMGVHTNMCVLGRPFGLRNLANAGKNVVLMRDLTDTMYNSRRRPQVSHFTGTDFVVEHVEEYVCPTTTSNVFTGEPAFRFKEDKRPLVVFISAENEYKAAETLPAFSHELELKHGLDCEILQASTEKQGEAIHTISGMEILTDAELVVVYARRRGFPVEQMKHLREFLDRGGPLIGLRTASHAFDSRGSAPKGHDEWPQFDPEVLGGSYHGHYDAGPMAAITAVAGVADHAILKGIELPLLSSGSLYRPSPLAAGAQLLLLGTIPDQPPEPVAWTNRCKGSRIFYTSLGHPGDFKNPQFRRLLVNAVFWALEKKEQDS
jgi:nicotinamidase-related amidase/type 1 glutamine amidotransferase